MVGGMGVDISTPELALAIAKLGGIAHISDAMLPAVVDRHFGTHFVREKRERVNPAIAFDLTELRKVIDRYVRATMNARRGAGAIFINVMEKLTMGNARETLATRFTAAMDAGIDGITMSAGLHMGSLELIKDHPRFRDVKLGIIISSVRALKIFMQRAAKVGRLPDYIVVEGPLAGGHLGFPLNWYDFDLRSIVAETLHLLDQQGLSIPVIPAGGIFTGADAVNMLEMGASAVQVATRFTVTRECGLPYPIQQAFFAATEADVVVNSISPTGYPMRMLKDSPAIGAHVKPMCDSFGYGHDRDGACVYKDEYAQPQVLPAGENKTCLCAMMIGYKTWTCGHTVSRLKETSNLQPDGTYQLLTAEQVFHDYTRSTDQRILVPPRIATEREMERAPEMLLV